MANETAVTAQRLQERGAPTSQGSQLRLSVEWLFGFALPMVCFAVDEAGFHVYGSATTAARVLVAIELLLFVMWHRGHIRGDFACALFGAAFGIGSGFALLTGVLLLPMSLVGCLALIGFLGLVPFGTCAAYAMLCIEALSRMRQVRILRAIGGGTLAITLTVGSFVAIRASERSVGNRALRMLDTANPSSFQRARRLLANLPDCDTSNLARPRFDDLLLHDLTRWCEDSWLDELRGFPDVGY
jgi:hypothetical protein